MKKRGFRIFFLLRLSPIIPFNALNYMAGMTAVTFRSYTLALIGILPGTILFVFVGASAGSSMDMGGTHVKNNARIASIGKLLISAHLFELKLHINNSNLTIFIIFGSGWGNFRGAWNCCRVILRKEGTE